MEIEKVIRSRVIRNREVPPNGLEYYQGQMSNYPTDGSYLNPDSNYKWRFIDMAHWVTKLTPSGGFVLDAGGATGNFGYWSKKLGLDINVIHTDLSHNAIRYGQTLYKHDSLQSNISNLPFSTSSFI